MDILFITANRLGDAILSTGVLHHVVRAHPEAQLTVASGPVAADLFRAVPRLKKMISLQKQPFYGHWRKLWAECWPVDWEMIIDFRHTPIIHCLRAKQRVQRVGTSGLHKVIQNAALIDRADDPPAPYIFIADDAHQKAQQWMGEGPVVALGPAANWPAKQWPVSHFCGLIHALLKKDDARFLILAAAHEAEMIAPAIAAVPEARRLLLLGADLQMAAACLARARYFVGNDSGLMHLSAAVGTPTLGLFGPSPHALYAPWGPKTRTIHTPESRDELLARLPYHGAFYPNLMGGLTVDAVLKGIEEF